MTNIDPTTLVLDASRLSAALAEINAAWKRFDPEHHTYKVGDFGTPASLGELLAQYDYGGPDWNGTLNWLASELLVDPPQSRTIQTQDDLPGVDVEYISYFHHGDLAVKGDFGAYKSIWITGDLIVDGVIEASYLDAYQDLIVGGDVRCAAINLMGLSMIVGRLDVSHFAFVDPQGNNRVLGGVRGPLLLGESEAVHDWNDAQVERKLDIEDVAFEELASVLGTNTDPKDEYAFEIVHRAFDAARLAG